jgi:alkanesulfonate monooxygenase SsuD/methylene tetrahydromethanopterin reductase-like flavin-dependent oxidoreductase (luciferase family)
VRTAAEKIDRDPDELVYSNALVLCIGETEAELERRAAAIGCAWLRRGAAAAEEAQGGRCTTWLERRVTDDREDSGRTALWWWLDGVQRCITLTLGGSIFFNMCMLTDVNKAS